MPPRTYLFFEYEGERILFGAHMLEAAARDELLRRLRSAFDSGGLTNLRGCPIATAGETLSLRREWHAREGVIALLMRDPTAAGPGEKWVVLREAAAVLTRELEIMEESRDAAPVTPAAEPGPGWAGIAEIMEHFKIGEQHKAAVDGRLKRFRKLNAANPGAVIEHDSPAKNQPRFLYNLAAVAPLLADLAAPDVRPTGKNLS